MSFTHPAGSKLEDHNRGNFKGATYIVKKAENDAYEITRKDRGGRIELIDGGSQEDNLRKARTRAQVMAKRNSGDKKEALVRIKPSGEVLGFGGKYDERKKTETPEEQLENLEDIGLRAKDPVGQCISKERESGRSQDQAVAICLSKRDRGELEDTDITLSDEDASEPNPDIDVNEDVEETLKELVEEHNSEVDKESRKATIGQLKSVYSRGRGAFTQTSRPGVDSATQWALARVKNAYLPLLKTGTPPNEDYVQDNDLLPEAHPQSTRGMSDRQAKLGRSSEETENSDNDEETQKIEWERDPFNVEGENGSFGETSEIVKFLYNPEYGEIKLMKRNNPRTDFNYSVSIQNPPEVSSIRNYKNKSGAERRFQKRKNLETDLTAKNSGFQDAEVSMEDLKKLTNAEDVLDEYRDETELTVEDLENWLDDPCHKRASGDDNEKHIKRAIFMMSEIDSPEDAVSVQVPEELAMDRAERRIPEELEGEVSYRLGVFQLEYAISFLQRHKGMIDDPEDISTDTEECPSISESALRNWGGSHFTNPMI